jgi:phosphatidylglycerophosphatase C
MTRTDPPVAFYDMDRTILGTPTFTLFLFWAAWTDKPWRLALTPLWLILALGYALKLYDRGKFKPAAIRIFLGPDMSRTRIARLAQKFAAWRVENDVQPGAKAAIARDRAAGYRLVMATAAPEFYAREIGAALQFDHVIASRHHQNGDGMWSAELDGPNCYGPEKARRVQQWLDEQSGRPAHIRAYSDHPSDAALFALANEAILVGHSAQLANLAQQHGWILRDFRISERA